MSSKPDDKIKIVLVGPKECGKTCIANFFAGDKTVLTSEYRPTIAARIREFDMAYSRNRTASIELWDLSGDVNFENCWPACSQDLNGVIIVVDNDSRTLQKDLEFWYSSFVKANNLEDSCCMVIAHSKDPSSSKSEIRLPKPMAKVTNTTHSNLDTNATTVSPNLMRNAFQILLESVHTKMREKEESRMMN